MFTRIIDEPLTSLVTVEMLKLHLRIDHNDDDMLLTSYLRVAHQQADAYTRRRMTEATIEGVFYNYVKRVYLPYGEISTVESLEATDRDGNNVVISDYKFNKTTQSVVIDSKYSKHTDFTITFKGGYTQVSAPKTIIQAIIMFAATLYEIREDISYGVDAYEMPLTSKRLLDPFVLYHSQGDHV